MAASCVHLEAALLNLNAEFERNGFGQTPAGLSQLLRTTARKPNETAKKMRHRIYSRLFGIMWHGCKIGKSQFPEVQPTFVFPECIKKLVQAVVSENIRDYEDPVGSHVYHVTLQDLVDTKWPTAKKGNANRKKN